MLENNSILKKLALALPDIPKWVETRSLLLSGRCQLFGLDETGTLSFVVRNAELKLISIVGFPERRAIEEAVEKNEGKCVVLAAEENGRHVSENLPGWEVSPASLHLLGKEARLPSISDKVVRLIRPNELNEISTLPPDLNEELAIASQYSPVAAAFAEDGPVSFCYAGAETEGLWDISIDTLERYRKQGYAGVCVAYMIEHMSREGKQPVWGAEEVNVASMRLAAKLGFEVVDKIMVFHAKEIA